jgi:chemotaxis signal transduction protein
MVGLVVDEVLDVRGLLVEEVPERSEGAVVRGLSTLDARAVVVLDLDALLFRVLLS